MGFTFSRRFSVSFLAVVVAIVTIICVINVIYLSEQLGHRWVP